MFFSYSTTPTLSAVDLDLAPGALQALIGPNGSGKTTLLKLLAGILPPAAGSVEWQGINIKRFSREEMARRVAFVPQELVVPFGLTVRETVMLGRTPHLRAFSGPTRRDIQAVESMLRLTETAALAGRQVSMLSGGEKQRVMLAMALAQEPQVLLLDEPTVHLDINHQVEILDLLRDLHRERGLTVLATMHDLNLAGLYFDKLLMLKEGRIVAAGAPASVLTAERVKQVFGANVRIGPHPTHPEAPQIALVPTAK